MCCMQDANRTAMQLFSKYGEQTFSNCARSNDVVNTQPSPLMKINLLNKIIKQHNTAPNKIAAPQGPTYDFTKILF